MDPLGKVVVLCRQLPDPAKSSGELRFWHVIRFFARNARELILFAEQPPACSGYAKFDVREIGRLKQGCRGASLALLEFWFMGKYIPLLRASRVPTILDSVDIEFLRRDRELRLLGKTSGYSSTDRRREIEAYRNADMVWAVSNPDAEAIRDIARSIAVVPNIVNGPRKLPPFAERSGVVFVGGFRHRPNVDGLRWYRDTILPRLSHLPHAIVGNDAPADIRAMREYIGGVPRSSDYVKRARVSVAPLRFGAGLKGKVLEAFACGTPVITTAIGCEGYENGREAAVIADDPEVFAAEVERLYTDERQWRKHAERGRQLAREYTSRRVYRNIARIVSGLVNTPRGSRHSRRMRTAEE